MPKYSWIEDIPRVQRPLSVAGLLRLISTAFATDFGDVRVTGEIRSVKTSGPGHVYIEIKDCHEEAQIQACLFRNTRSRVPYIPRVGDVIEAVGSMNIYAPRGSMSLVIRDIRLAGSGDLYAQFLALKEKLAKEGLFDESRKKTLPTYPLTVGVVTSPEAAALRDVIKTIRLMAPHVSVILYPSGVQGEGSDRELVHALFEAQRRQEVDVLLLVRGGGSLTDLWTFNSEILARTLAEIKLPVISGVGHETDITIADMVSDFRAATPTAAAEIAVRGWRIAKDRMDVYSQHMHKALASKLELAHLQMKAIGNMDSRVRFFCEGLEQRLVYDEDRLRSVFDRNWQRRYETLNNLSKRLKGQALDLEPHRRDVKGLAERLSRAAEHTFGLRRMRLEGVAGRLQLLDTHKILERGFVLATDGEGNYVKSGQGLVSGQLLQVHFLDAVAKTRVELVTEKK